MIDVWIGNLGKYNEGELVGGWLKLPKTNEEIDKFLKEVVMLNEEYEEYMINDYATDLPLHIGEYENLKNLNLIAKIAENVTEMEAIEAYVDSQGEMTLEELANLMEQEDDIGYYRFSSGNEYMSSEEKMGYEMAESIGIIDTLRRMGIEDFFDFESYGRSWENGDITIMDNGYIDFGNTSVDLHKYSLEELAEMNGLDEVEEVEKLKIVFKAVGEDPKIMEIDNTLEAKQKLVGGLIEVVPYKNDLLLICNEEGKITNLKPNLKFDYDYIVGDCFVVGDDYENGDFKSLAEDEIKTVIEDLKERSFELEEVEEIEETDDMEF